LFSKSECIFVSNSAKSLRPKFVATLVSSGFQLIPRTNLHRKTPVSLILSFRRFLIWSPHNWQHHSHASITEGKGDSNIEGNMRFYGIEIIITRFLQLYIWTILHHAGRQIRRKIARRDSTRKSQYRRQGRCEDAI